MAFITKNNARQLEYQANRGKIERIMIQDLYKLSLWMLTKKEQQWLGAARMFYENPEFYLKHIYQKSEKKPNLNLVYLPGRPAYHEDKDCVVLNGNYINYEIPFDVIKKGESAVQEFRDWWKSEEQLLNSNPDRFWEKMSIRWLLTSNVNSQQIQANNSGIETYENYDLSETEMKIDKLIRSMEEIRKNNFSLIDEFGKVTYKILVTKEIEIKNLSDQEILSDWDNKKSLLKREMRLFFQLKFNPDIEIKESLLESLGFVKCSRCHKKELMLDFQDK
jgi:hypothetical protein